MVVRPPLLHHRLHLRVEVYALVGGDRNNEKEEKKDIKDEEGEGKR